MFFLIYYFIIILFVYLLFQKKLLPNKIAKIVAKLYFYPSLPLGFIKRIWIKMNYMDLIDKKNNIWCSAVLFEKHINFSEMKHNISIYCDPLKLKQVLINILQNGIQYSNSNEISFRYFATHYSINFEISHKTAKIYNNLDTIFDINERCNDMTNNEGSGLGLFIAKELAKKLGGTLNVHQDNNMINFIVELKLEPQQECTIVPKTVLYVDDFFGFKCTQLLLEMHGMDTTHVSSGEEAIELCKTENTFDIVLVDKNMKGIDGIETIQQLRKCNMNKNATYFGFTGELTNAFEEINVQTLMKPLNIENFKSIVFN